MPAVSVRGVTKSFRIPHGGAQTIKERVLHPLGAGGEELVALRDVDFEIEPGEFFAVIGRNGSGKSTLLRCIAGIYRQQRGEIAVDGRIAPLIELGVGFNPELNARDNVVVNATLMGLSPEEARRRFPAILEFAELEQFADLKLRNYSTGMRTRLGFATAVEVDAEILLVDEVLAVGDAAFQAKCLRTFKRMKDEGRTIVLVSHTPGLVQLADRVLLLEEGRVAELGDPGTVWQTYQRLSRERIIATGGESAARIGDGAAVVLDAWFESSDGVRTTSLRRGERVSVGVRARFQRDLNDPVIGFYLTGENRVLVMHLNNRLGAAGLDGEGIGAVRAGETRTLITSFDNWLGGGLFALSPYVAHADGREAEVVNDMLHIEVEAELTLGSIIDPPREMRLLEE